MTETYATPSAVALMSALTDAAMLEPSSVGTNLLFRTDIFDIRQQAEGSINNAGIAGFTVPLTKVLIVLYVPYGKRQSYMTFETAEDWQMWIKFRIYGNTGSDIQDAKTRLEFVSEKRLNVLSSYGIYDFGIDEHPRMKAYDPKLGFALLDHTLRYRWSPDN
jgi:hypothetical protein